METMSLLYAPLDATVEQIRLLKIHAGADTTRLKCTLTTVGLHSTTFDALSYCWGPPHHPMAIDVNGVELWGTPNLAAALKHFRRIGVGADIPIWVDAICINQSYHAERSSQVALMSTLYRKASTVHIWLGTPSVVPDLGMSALADLAAFTLHHRSTRSMQTWPNSDDQDGMSKLQHLLLLSTNTYWTRTWIVQEIAFAMNCVVHGADRAVVLSGQDGDFSSRTFPFYEMLQRITIAARRHSSDTEAMIQLCKKVKDAFYHIETTGFVAKIRDHANEPSFARLITEVFLRYRPLLATDPRDKVYGMLGLLPSKLELPPDYTKSVRQVYVDCTAELIRSSKDVQMVNDACSGSPDLPTWVPDLRVPCRFQPHFVQKLMAYRASAGLPANFRIDKNGSLITHGLCIDTIAELERGIEHESSLHDMQSAFSRRRALFDRAAALSADQCSEAQLDSAFWNAVTHSSEGAELFDDDDAQLCAQLMSPDSTMSASNLKTDHADMIRILEDVAHNYDIFLTATGYLGRVPKGNAEVGDCLTILAGAPAPFCAVKQHIAGSETYALRAPCILLPFDTNPDGGEFDGTNPTMNGSWLLGQAGLESLLDVHEGKGKNAVLDLLHEITIC